MSEDAAIYWAGLSPEAQAQYDPAYVGMAWEKIPKQGRRLLSYYMNARQGRGLAPEKLGELMDSIFAGSKPKKPKRRKRPANVRKPGSKKPKRRKKPLEIVEEGYNFDIDFGAGEGDAHHEVYIDFKKFLKSILINKSVKTKSKLRALVFGLVAGAGGVATGSWLRSRLIERGFTEQGAKRAIQAAVNHVYRIHERNARLVSKARYIQLQVEPRGMELGTEVMYNGKTGVVVSKQGDYIEAVDKAGVKEELHYKSVIDKAVAFMYKGKPAMWDRLDDIDRSRILSKYDLPHSYMIQDWDYLPWQIQYRIRGKGLVKFEKSHRRKRGAGTRSDIEDYTDFDEYLGDVSDEELLEVYEELRAAGDDVSDHIEEMRNRGLKSHRRKRGAGTRSDIEDYTDFDEYLGDVSDEELLEVYEELRAAGDDVSDHIEEMRNRGLKSHRRKGEYGNLTNDELEALYLDLGEDEDENEGVMSELTRRGYNPDMERFE